MSFTRSRLAATLVLFLSTLLASARAFSQTPSERRASAAPTLRSEAQPFWDNCASYLPNLFASSSFAAESEPRFSANEWIEGWRLPVVPPRNCFETLSASPSPATLRSTNSLPPNSGAPPTLLPALDPVSSDLAALGKLGVPISRARQMVLQILSSDNACSEWFATKDSVPAGTFRSLTFSIDRHGPDTVLESNPPTSALRYFRQPYVARATQASGPYSDITVNGNGAFFREQGAVQKVREGGGPLANDGARLLVVGPYPGTTLEAQVVTLLHEFGHVIDLLPEDADDLDGQSGRNTDAVLRHCRSQIEFASKLSRSSAKR